MNKDIILDKLRGLEMKIYKGRFDEIDHYDLQALRDAIKIIDEHVE